MPYATNPSDGDRTFFLDEGGADAAVPLCGGNDPLALDAVLRSTHTEGSISRSLRSWRVSCLICAGAGDEMHDDAQRAAAESPNASFVTLAGHSHLSAFYEADALILPHIQELLRSTPPPTPGSDLRLRQEEHVK